MQLSQQLTEHTHTQTGDVGITDGSGQSQRHRGIKIAFDDRFTAEGKIYAEKDFDFFFFPRQRGSGEN